MGGQLPFGFTPPEGRIAIPNNVAVSNGIIAASYVIVTIATYAQQPERS